MMRPLRIAERNPFGIGGAVLLAVIFFCIVIPDSVAAQNRPAQILVSEFIFTQAGFEQCHASTLLELSDGDFVAA